MALNTSFFYFIILWKGQADVMVDGPLGRGLLVAGEPRLPLVILSETKERRSTN